MQHLPRYFVYYILLASAALIHSAVAGTTVPSAPAIKSATEIVDHIVWNNIPIHVVLPVGQERRIDFPVPVKIEWPDDVSKNTRNLQLRENGSIYWTAGKAFTLHRVNVFTMTGESFLLDVEAKKKASTRPLVILDDRFPDNSDNASGENANHEPDPVHYDGVDLVRLAAQYLYAPRRLVNHLPGVTRVPVSTNDVRLYKGGMLKTCAIAQWKSPGSPSLYVTAVRVTSDSFSKEILDPRNLRGDWISATPEHGMVNPAGEEGDTTAWYLVSRRPFEESFNE